VSDDHQILSSSDPSQLELRRQVYVYAMGSHYAVEDPEQRASE
jgi:hypothetical protein